MLASIVPEAARRFGDRAALVAPDGWTVPYADLDRLSDEAAAGMAARGVRHGDVVALAMPSSPDYVIAYVAAAKLGAFTAGVNPRLSAVERDRVLGVAAPRLVLAAPDLATGSADLVAPASRAADVLRDLRVVGAAPPAPREDPANPVAIVFTSGTTGIPKGAVFLERQIRAVAEIDPGQGWGGGGPMIASTELVHIGFMTKLAWHLRSGATIFLLRRWRAADALRLIAEHRMRSIGGIPAQIALLLRSAELDRYDVSSVEQIVVGGAPAWPTLIAEARARFRARFMIRYSQTESGGVGISTAPDADDEELLHTVGRPRGGIELSIRDDDDRALPAGEPGEVCLRSAAVMEGYWRNAEATARVLRGGWLHTGDSGFVDDRGLLHLTGRRDDMYIRGGYNVHPREVEAVLADHPLVREVAVVPRADDVMGQIGVAVVVPREHERAPSLDDLRAFGAARLAAYKLPEALRIVEELPLTSMHKIDRRRLVENEARATT